MFVAVSVNETGSIAGHLGKCKIFYIFHKSKERVQFLERRVLNMQKFSADNSILNIKLYGFKI